MTWRFLYAVPSWLAFLVLRTLFILIGWIVVPLAAACKAYKAVDDTDGAGNPRVEYHFTWPWMFPWDNHEDGIANDTYKKFDSMFMQIVYWSCLRNPANNLRIIPWLSVKIDPKKVEYVGTFGDSIVDKRTPLCEVSMDWQLYDTNTPHWFFAWHGFYSNYYRVFEWRGGLWRFWIGWKVMPKDLWMGVSYYRQRGAGFATQFKKVGEKNGA